MKKNYFMLSWLKILLAFFIILLLQPINVFGQWIQQPFSSSGPLTKVRFADSTTGWILGENYIYKTSNGGYSWFPQDSSGGDGAALTVLNENIVFYSRYTWMAPYSGMLRKTTDGGLSWQTVDTLAFYWGEIQFLDDQTGYGGGGSLPDWHPMLRKTTNGGSTWFTAWSDTGQYNIEGIHFLNIDLGWSVLYDAVILKTTNGGIDWAVSDTIRHYPTALLPLRDITFATPDSGWAVGGIAGDAIVVRTTDAGANWTYQLFTGSSLREVKFFNSKVGWICGANNFEPFIAKTSNGGETWITQHQVPYSVSGAESFSMIDTVLGWAVNYDGEVYKTTNGGVTFIDNEPVRTLPISYHLFQNYPNPFNPNTTIKYSVPQTSNVVIKVFDVLGNEIATLVNEEKSEGTYKIEYDGYNLPSGVYFYQLQADSYLQTKKMILLK